jgi:hypothetical protein
VLVDLAQVALPKIRRITRLKMLQILRRPVPP